MCTVMTNSDLAKQSRTACLVSEASMPAVQAHWTCAWALWSETMPR